MYLEHLSRVCSFFEHLKKNKILRTGSRMNVSLNVVCCKLMYGVR
jgi:hypothetical protein